MKFLYYQDHGDLGKWHWKMLANNGNVVALSAVGHKNKIECLRAIYLVKSTSYSASVEDSQPRVNQVIVKG